MYLHFFREKIACKEIRVSIFHSMALSTHLFFHTLGQALTDYENPDLVGSIQFFQDPDLVGSIQFFQDPDLCWIYTIFPGSGSVLDLHNFSSIWICVGSTQFFQHPDLCWIYTIFPGSGSGWICNVSQDTDLVGSVYKILQDPKLTTK